MDDTKKNNPEMGGEEVNSMNDTTPEQDSGVNTESTTPETNSGAEGATAADSGQTADAANSKMMPIVIAVLAVALLAGAYFMMNNGMMGDGSGSGSTEATNTEGSGAQSINEADLPEVIATVNGEEITRETFVENVQFLEASMAQQGANTSEPGVAMQIQQQALDQAINNELMAQAAAEAGVTVSDEDFEAEFENVKSQFPDEAAFEAEMERVGLTIEELRENIRAQMTMNAYIDSSDALADAANVAEEEIQAFYDQLGAQGGEIPALEDIRAQIEAQLAQQNEQSAISEMLVNLREEADININFEIDGQ